MDQLIEELFAFYYEENNVVGAFFSYELQELWDAFDAGWDAACES